LLTLCKEGKVRLFKFLSGIDEYLVMMMEDYLVKLNQIKESSSPEHAEIIAVFIEKIIPNYVDIFISKEYIEDSIGSKVPESYYTALVNKGVLLNKDAKSFWIAIPSSGPLLKAIAKARKEICIKLARKKYKEILVADFKYLKFKTTDIDMMFHVRDLIGQGVVELVSSPCGDLVRLK